MGHYASEMDPDFGKPSDSKIKLQAVQEDVIRDLANLILQVSGNEFTGSSVVAQRGIDTAYAIDALIRQRVAEAMATKELTTDSK